MVLHRKWVLDMDIERIAPIIIFVIIWGVSSAIRKSPKENAGADKSRVPGAGLMDILQRRIQTALEEVDEDELVELDSYFEPTVDDPAFPQAKIDVSAPRRQKAKGSPETVLSDELGGEMESCDMPQMQVDLKKAIIWAEILAPPVGMRDQ